MDFDKLSEQFRDFDSALRPIELGSRTILSADDLAFVNRILDSVTTGSKGVFVVLHPNDRLQFMLLNTDRLGAIGLLAHVIKRISEADPKTD